MSTQPQLSPIEQLMQGSQPSSPAQSQGQDSLSPIEQLMQTKDQPAAQPTVDPAQDASNTRQMLVSGLTGMPTPNMTEQDKASFANGKAAGAGTATLLSAAPLLGVLAPHLPDLDKAWKIAATLMGGSATVDHVIHVLKTLRGK
jgi:hypothetical protein